MVIGRRSEYERRWRTKAQGSKDGEWRMGWTRARKMNRKEKECEIGTWRQRGWCSVFDLRIRPALSKLEYLRLCNSTFLHLEYTWLCNTIGAVRSQHNSLIEISHFSFYVFTFSAWIKFSKLHAFSLIFDWPNLTNCINSYFSYKRTILVSYLGWYRIWRRAEIFYFLTQIQIWQFIYFLGTRHTLFTQHQPEWPLPRESLKKLNRDDKGKWFVFIWMTNESSSDMKCYADFLQFEQEN